MTAKELIDETDRLFGYECDKKCSECNGCPIKDTFNEVKRALEKQIPKKPIPIDWEQYKDKVINAEYLRGGYWCPNCKHMIKSGEYCVDCGQKILWSDGNGKAN